MRKKISSVIGLLILTPLLVLLLLWGGEGAPARRAGAAHVDSSFTQLYNISYSSDPNTNASQKPKVKLAPDGYLHVAWMDGKMNSATGPARVYKAGETFFEPPGSEHLVSENASATEPASLLAIFVADDGAQLTIGAK